MRALLHGIRVIDCTIAAQPITARFLADFGAEIIRVETPSRPVRLRNSFYPDGRPDDDLYWEQGAGHHDVQRNKLGIAIEISKPSGQKVFKRLVAISDVLIENSPSGTMKKFGLDYEQLREVNPNLIMLSITGYGHGGPYTAYRAYGYNIESMSGMTAMMGYDSPQRGTIPYPDQIAISHAVVALLAALRQRRRTGKGQWIDLSMTHAALCTLGESFVDFAMNGRLRTPMGNRDDAMTPHGCYRCLGPDNWVAIAVNGDAQWRSLSAEMGSDGQGNDERFASVEGRRANQDELDKIVEEWTSTLDQYEVTDRLQRRGIAAGPVLSCKGLYLDPHLHQRGLFPVIEHPPTHPRVGKRPLPGPFWKLSETPGSTHRCAPTFGRDNDFVFGEILGLSTEEMQQLEESGAIGHKPIPWYGKPPTRPLPPEEAFKLGRLSEYDADYKEKLAVLYGETG